MPYLQLSYNAKIAGISALTVRRYSTARSGLLKAARIARSISTRGKPIVSIFAIAAFRWAPSVNADGSLKLPLSIVEVGGAGDGVEGAFDVELGAGTGAAGVAGVCVALVAGVDGGLAADDDPADPAFGFAKISQNT